MKRVTHSKSFSMKVRRKMIELFLEKFEGAFTFLR